MEFVIGRNDQKLGRISLSEPNLQSLYLDPSRGKLLPQLCPSQQHPLSYAIGRCPYPLSHQMERLQRQRQRSRHSSLRLPASRGVLSQY
jgi:hypothetical protein